MKKMTIALLAALLLAGCKHTTDTGLATPVAMPELPAFYAEKAKRLPAIEDATMGGRELAGVESDKQYNDVAHRYNGLLTIYECVRIALKDKKDPSECLK